MKPVTLSFDFSPNPVISQQFFYGHSGTSGFSSNFSQKQKVIRGGIFAISDEACLHGSYLEFVARIKKRKKWIS
jgi:hypothetical protein